MLESGKAEGVSPKTLEETQGIPSFVFFLFFFFWLNFAKNILPMTCLNSAGVKKKVKILDFKTITARNIFGLSNLACCGPSTQVQQVCFPPPHTHTHTGPRGSNIKHPHWSQVCVLTGQTCFGCTRGPFTILGMWS